ncbi:MAG: hypothetical protein HY397_02025 [Candidatus Doudnabacteria bacterium]|nr:hypothetical protein [Candidatus Doudnabacteria bacterium]
MKIHRPAESADRAGSTFELPPLLVRTLASSVPSARLLAAAQEIVSSDCLVASRLPQPLIVQNTHELALNLAERYLTLAVAWLWGDSILSWIKQCETAFQVNSYLSALVYPDLWPHCYRVGFVELARSKKVQPEGFDLDETVGFRLNFRTLPRIELLTDLFIMAFNREVLMAGYRAWSGMVAERGVALPSGWFSFQVIKVECDLRF